jgi:hypothetical protein
MRRKETKETRRSRRLEGEGDWKETGRSISEIGRRLEGDWKETKQISETGRDKETEGAVVQGWLVGLGWLPVGWVAGWVEAK